MTENLFDIAPKINRNSVEFDKQLLENLKQLKDIPTNKFMASVRKIMRQKSSCKLWFTNNQSKEWDADERVYKDCNFRCVPTTRKAKSYFCLWLDRTEKTITVTDGFLTSI